MKKGILSSLIAVMLTSSLLVSCGGSAKTTGDTKPSEDSSKTEVSKSSESKDESYKVFLITMDQMDQHWVTVNKGCEKAVEELGNVDYKWLAPDVKDDAKQIEAINNAIAGGADAIVLAANGPDAVVATLQEAVSEGVIIIYVDSPANMPAEATFSTDNKAAGKTAGEKLLETFSDNGVTNGDLGIIGTNASTTSTVQREEGFREAFSNTDFNILETQYCDGDATRAKDIAANFITAGTVGIFGGNEGSSVGVGNAIAEASDSDVLGIGFDKSDALFEHVESGNLVGIMAQNPDVMGYESMKAAIDVLNGADLGGKVVDTGVSIITKDNVNDFR